MRLIEANEAIKIINHAAEVCNSGITRGILELVAVRVENLKTIEAEPVKHGRWKRSGALLECQCCGEIYSQLGGNAGKSWNYCPNCGAKMRGNTDE